MDPSWEPLNPTPGHPEYNSAQAVLGAAAAYPLNKIHGKNVAFPPHDVDGPPGSTRSYLNFEHAVAESADSRIWGGIHFRSATDTAAQKQGKLMGRFLFERFLDKRFLEEADDYDDDV